MKILLLVVDLLLTISLCQSRYQVKYRVIIVDSIDSVDNMSDHRVLVAELNFDVERMPKTARKYERKASWRSASSIDLLAYKQTLCTLLEGISVPQSALACHNLSCTEHTEQIDDFTVSPFGGAVEESLLITGWSFESRGNHANLIDSSM